MRNFFAAGSLFIATVCAPPALAAVTPPGSTAEYKAAAAAVEMAHLAGMYEPGGRVAQEKQQTALALLRKACDATDAEGCIGMAFAYGGYSWLPSPRGPGRQVAAHRAATLLDQFCTSPGGEWGCKRLVDFVKEIRESDAKLPALDRSGGLPTFWAKAGAYKSRMCLAGYEKVGRFTDCREAVELLEERPAELKALRETLCTKDSQVDCHAIGRLSNREDREEKALVRGCEAGSGDKCASLAARWAYREWSGPNYRQQAASWAAKGCARKTADACAMHGELLIGSKSYAEAADAFGQACNLETSARKDRYCTSETKIRSVLAKQK